MNKISAILAKEIASDIRNPFTLAGSGLFLLSSLFVCYMAMKRINAASTWVALYWIIVLFTGFNAVAKSFTNESRERMLYFYTIHNPAEFIASKMAYNGLLMLVLSGLAFLVYAQLFDMPIDDMAMFTFGILFGSMGISIVLSMLSTIASKAGKNLTLLAILGLPILLPIILVSIKITKNAVDGIDWSVQWKYAFVLIGLNVVCFALSLVLFPYLWRE